MDSEGIRTIGAKAKVQECEENLSPIILHREEGFVTTFWGGEVLIIKNFILRDECNAPSTNIVKELEPKSEK
jgi:hypothetical protein